MAKRVMSRELSLPPDQAWTPASNLAELGKGDIERSITHFESLHT